MRSEVVCRTKPPVLFGAAAAGCRLGLGRGSRLRLGLGLGLGDAAESAAQAAPGPGTATGVKGLVTESAALASLASSTAMDGVKGPGLSLETAAPAPASVTANLGVNGLALSAKTAAAAAAASVTATGGAKGLATDSVSAVAGSVSAAAPWAVAGGVELRCRGSPGGRVIAERGSVSVWWTGSAARTAAVASLDAAGGNAVFAADSCAANSV